MKVRTSLTERDLTLVIANVSGNYAGNVTAEIRPLTRTTSNVKVRTRSSREIGSRRSWTGRRGPWACWHVFRDVIGGIMEVDETATVSTSLVTYRGREDFLTKFPETAWQNVGSMVHPVYMVELCDCEE